MTLCVDMIIVDSCCVSGSFVDVVTAVSTLDFCYDTGLLCLHFDCCGNILTAVMTL